MAATAVLKLVNVHIFFTKQGRNMNEVCFCIYFLIWGIQWETQICDKIQNKLLPNQNKLIWIAQIVI